MKTQRPPDMPEDLYAFAVNQAHELALEIGIEWPACAHCGEPVDAQGDRYCPECNKAGAEYRLSGVA